MSRDRSKPWGKSPDPEPDHTESDTWDDEATHGTSKRRAPRRGSRRNDDETNVGGSLLPGDDFGLAAVFEQALAPAYVSEPADEVERTEPAGAAPPPAPAKPSGSKPSPRRPAPPKPTPEPSFDLPEERAPRAATRPADPPKPRPSLPTDDDLGLGPVEEFTISGLMPDELKAMADAALEATNKADSQPRPAPSKPRPPKKNVHADPPRTSRHDPDPLITGVLAPAGGAPPGQRPSVDDEETLAMNLNEHPDLMEKLRPPDTDGGRDYHTFGAGLQRLDQLPDTPKKKKSDEPSGGGILELLDGSPPPASPTGPNPAPGPSKSDADRPRRVSTNRAGSMGRSGRAPTPTPARQRSVAPNTRGATPRPAPSRSERDKKSSPPQREALRRSGGRAGRPSAPPKPSTPAPRPTSSGRAQDEEARIRAALASVSDDEHTSWVKFDEPELSDPAPKSRAPGNRPRAQRPERPEGDLPGVTPIGMTRQPEAKQEESGLTMDLVGVKPSGEPTRPVDPSAIGDEATIPNARSSLGDEVTVPARPLGDEPTMPVKVPNTRAKSEPAAGAKPPSAKPPPKRPPSAKPPPKKPGPASGSTSGSKSKPPVEIAALGEEKAESYRDGALPWIASMFAVMVIGSGVILFLILLLYMI